MNTRDKILCILLLVASGIGFIFFPKEVQALDFEVNGETIQVNDLESFRDYIYFNNSQSGTIPFGCFISGNDTYKCIGLSDNTRYRYFSDSFVGIGSYNGDNLESQYMAMYQMGNLYPWATSGGIQTISYNNINNYFSMQDIKDFDTENIIFTANFTANDIECKYKTSNCIEDKPEEPKPEEPSQEELTKEDFYKMGWVGITALCVLIFILFFKWCFPMKMKR